VPELPEIAAHAARLDAAFAGGELTSLRPLAFTALKTFDPAPDEAVGHPLLRVGHRGKHLLVVFEPVTFVVHLMQGGRLESDEKQAAKPRGGLARWTFADGRALLLTETGTEKRAGVWVVAGDPEGQAPLAGLGPDADRLTPELLAERLTGQSMRLHGWLRDQHRIAGIGRRLANEICHRARLSPFANAAKLDGEEQLRLLTAIDSCLAESMAFEHGREAMSSSKERPSEVHHRVGEPCPVCGDTVRSVAYSAYTVAYCPTCQTGGKILADNTTSRFLK
jgi:formamidopyrimidine-DNA glycosylase